MLFLRRSKGAKGLVERLRFAGLSSAPSAAPSKADTAKPPPPQPSSAQKPSFSFVNATKALRASAAASADRARPSTSHKLLAARGSGAGRVSGEAAAPTDNARDTSHAETFRSQQPTAMMRSHAGSVHVATDEPTADRRAGGDGSQTARADSESSRVSAETGLAQALKRDRHGAEAEADRGGRKRQKKKKKRGAEFPLAEEDGSGRYVLLQSGLAK
jgi:hypothetical protein